MTITFTGTVVACETRFTTKVRTAVLTDHLSANWIVTVDITSADPDPPAATGERASFLFHSPAQLVHASAEQVTGWTCRFTIERARSDGRIEWSALTATRIE